MSSTIDRPTGAPSRRLSAGRAAAPGVRVLDVDPDLGTGLSEPDMAAATRALVAPVIKIVGTRWQPPTYDPHTTYGLLLLDGLIGRRLRVGRAVATELLSGGDIIRPWEEEPLWGLTEPELEWRIFQPTRLAVLGRDATALIGRRPELVVNFSARLLRRVRAAAYLMAVSHQTRVEDRLMETLGYLASTWGRVTPRGTRIPFRITHEVLSEILGAQRPSVTTAFGSLMEQGLVTREPDGTLILSARAASPVSG